MDSWAGAFVTAGTPKQVIDTLTAAAARVVKSREFGFRIEKTGGVVQYVTPAGISADRIQQLIVG